MAHAFVKFQQRFYPILNTFLVIGRGPDCGICVEDDWVSRQHVFVVAASPEYWLFDYKSANGVYLKGRRLTGPARLADGDSFAIGRGLSFEFVVKGPEDEAAVAEPSPEAAKPSGSLSETRTLIRRGGDLLESSGKASELLEGLMELHACRAVDLLPSMLLSLAMRFVGAARGFVMLERDGQMTCVVGDGVDEGAYLGDKGIARDVVGRVRETGAPVVETLGTTDGGQGPDVGQMACVPLAGEDKVLGLLYVDTRAGSPLLGVAEVDTLKKLGGHGGVAVANAMELAGRA